MRKIIFLLSAISFLNISIASQTYDVLVTKKGFEPSKIDVEAGKEVVLNVTRKVKITCAKKITIPSEGVEKKLPLNKTVSLKLTPKKKGEIKFGCAMKQMLGGVIFVK